MSTANQGRSGYSADVRIELHLAERVFAVGQLGPDFVERRSERSTRVH